jgi:hypothetical protein
MKKKQFRHLNTRLNALEEIQGEIAARIDDIYDILEKLAVPQGHIECEPMEGLEACTDPTPEAELILDEIVQKFYAAVEKYHIPGSSTAVALPKDKFKIVKDFLEQNSFGFEAWEILNYRPGTYILKVNWEKVWITIEEVGDEA